MTINTTESQTSINFARNVAGDERGRVHLVWFEEGNTTRNIYYKRSIDGGASWGLPFQLTNVPEESHFPSIAVDGESLTVDVWLHSQTQRDLVLASIQFDFTDSDPSLTLDPAFTFDFSSLGDQTNHYLAFHFPELPVPWTANTILCCCPSTRLLLPAGSSLHIGSVGLRLPTAPGVYRLDALNSAEADESLGGWIRTSPDCCESCPTSEIWRAFTGEITGGTFDFVIPPPIPTVSQWGLIVMTTLLLV